MKIQHLDFSQVVQIFNFVNTIERQIQPHEVYESIQVFNLLNDIIAQLKFC